MPSVDSFNYRSLPALAAYIDRVGAEMLSYRKYIVKERNDAYYLQKAFIRISNYSAINCNTVDHKPTKEEAEAIKEEIKQQNWPKSIGAANLSKL